MPAPTLHDRLERSIGVDVRLFYGLLVPVALVVALVVGLALAPTWWLLAPLVMVLIAATGIVIVGFLQMLDGGDNRS